MRPVPTTSSPRQTFTSAPRTIFPLSTSEPEIMPELKRMTFLMVALPKDTSTTSGSNRPSMAALMSSSSSKIMV